MATPRYALIADSLRRRIKAGKLAPGAKIPSLAQLAEQFGVSEIVARQAIQTLVAEGLVTTKPRVGTVVAERASLVRVAPQRYRPDRATTTFVEEGERAGLEVTYQHATSKVQATDDVADRLQIAAGDQVTQTDLAVAMGGVPVSVSCTWEPLAFTEGTDIEVPHEGPYGHLGIVDRFATQEIRIREVEEALAFRPSEDDESHRLDIPRGMWVIQIDQQWLANEGVVAASRILFRPDRYRFIYRLPIPEPEPVLMQDDYGDEIGPLGGMLESE